MRYIYIHESNFSRKFEHTVIQKLVNMKASIEIQNNSFKKNMHIIKRRNKTFSLHARIVTAELLVHAATVI